MNETKVASGRWNGIRTESQQDGMHAPAHRCVDSRPVMYIWLPTSCVYASAASAVCCGGLCCSVASRRPWISVLSGSEPSAPGLLLHPFHFLLRSQDAGHVAAEEWTARAAVRRRSRALQPTLRPLPAVPGRGRPVDSLHLHRGPGAGAAAVGRSLGARGCSTVDHMRWVPAGSSAWTARRWHRPPTDRCNAPPTHT